MASPYEVLGVPPDATHAQIKKAYRKLALRHHPDRNAGDAAAAERFKAIAGAYEVLTDPRRRRGFDTTGQTDNTERRTASPGLQVFLRTFDQQLQVMTGLWFDEVLPRMLEAYYRGRGVELLARLLDDLDQHRLLTRLTDPPPSEASRARSADVRASCPVTVRPVEMVDARGKLVLGALLQAPKIGSNGLEFAYRIELYPGSFLATGVKNPDEIGAAMLPVLARECIRYLETFVPPDDRPTLARAEHRAGLRPAELSLQEARRRDSLFLAKRWGGVALFVLVVALLLAAILPAWA